MFANLNQPIYGFWARNENYGEDECFVQFYFTKLYRDRGAAKYIPAFEVFKFEIMLPRKE